MRCAPSRNGRGCAAGANGSQAARAVERWTWAAALDGACGCFRARLVPSDSTPPRMRSGVRGGARRRVRSCARAPKRCHVAMERSRPWSAVSFSAVCRSLRKHWLRSGAFSGRVARFGCWNTFVPAALSAPACRTWFNRPGRSSPAGAIRIATPSAPSRSPASESRRRDGAPAERCGDSRPCRRQYDRTGSLSHADPLVNSTACGSMRPAQQPG